MSTKLFTHLGALGMVAVSLLAGTAAAPDYSNSFSAMLTGVVRSTISGEATFGRVSGGPTAPDVFTVTLGADSSQGAVLFTQPSGLGLKVGSYRISEGGSDERDVQALVLIGSASRPQGVFRTRAGTLTITSISDYEVTGLFFLDARGFFVSAPNQENHRVSVSGSFTARRRS
jgi:hypothetical protein